MADNTPFVASTDPAAPKIADDEVPYSGDNAKVQIIQLATVDGVEGSRTLTKWGDVSLGVGAPTDAAAVSDAPASASLVSLIKRQLGKWTAQLPAALTALGALKTGPIEGTATMTVAVGTNTPATGLDTAGIRNMGLIVPSNFDGSTISFTVCDTLGGTYVPLNNIWGQPVSMTVAISQAYDIPGELMWARFFKIVTGTNQAGTDTIFTLMYRS